MRSSTRSVTGAARFDVMVTVVIIFVLLGVLLDRLADVQRASERTVVDMEVAVLRTELQMVIVSRMTRGEDAQLAGWAGRNPMELAWGEASNTQTVEGVALTRRWRWDAGAGVLVYDFRGGECLQLRLAKINPGGINGWLLGGGLILVPTHKEKNC